MSEQNERYYTPKEIEKTGYKGVTVCQATQVEYRKSGRLGHYKIGNKVYYAALHLENFLSLCESTGTLKQN